MDSRQRKFWAQLVLLLLVSVVPAIPMGHAQVNSQFGNSDTQLPTCRCCTAGKWACCSGCPGTAMFSAPKGLSLESIVPAGEPQPPPSPLGVCRFKNTLDLKAYPKREAAEAFYAQPSVQACDAYMPTVLKRRDAIIENYQQGNSSAEDVEISRKYAELCLAEAASVYNPTLSASARQTIYASTVILLGPNDQPYCHGIRIKDHVLTAQHCADTLPGNSKTMRHLGFAEKLTANVVWRGAKPLQEPRDLALLAISHATASTASISLGEPIVNARLLIVQMNLFKVIAGNLGPTQSFEAASTVEDNPSCRLFGVAKEGYLLHACQTERGTSGAAMFQKDANGRLRLIGVHSGPTARIPDPNLNQCSISLPNYGVRIPLSDIRKAMQRAN